MPRSCGVDPGTMFFQVAEKKEGQEGLTFTNVRNAFVELADTEGVDDILARNDWQYIKDGDVYYVIGDDAIQVANILPGKVEVRRPMADGVLNKNEDKKLIVLAEIIESSIGKAPDDNSWICSCVSSESVDGSQDSVFHRQRLEALYKRLGWNVKIIEEGHAVVLSERPTVIENGDEVAYSGIGLSCLCPGTKIYTKRGILPIEEIKIGDEVLTHAGNWKSVDNVIVQDYEGEETGIQVTGYTNDTNEYRFVKNHELYVLRDSSWKWVGCDSIEEGDVVGEPITKRDFNSFRPSMTICERVTCSNDYSKKRIEISADVFRLIGYFLGDGSILRSSNSGIKFDFGIEEKEYAQDVAEILLKNFNKSSSVNLEPDDGTIRIECHSKGIGEYFRKHFYDKDGSKIFPWDISRLSKGDCLNLLVGLVRSDGWNGNQIGFSNTSSQLVILFRQLAAKIGFASTLNYREPRINTTGINGREIIGKKTEWTSHISCKDAFSSLSEIINNTNCSNSKYVERIFVQDGFLCGRVQKIEKKPYSGPVYDLSIRDDHSFSGPFMTIHNCGAGRTNLVLCYKGLQVVGMSCARGGDYIDQQVSEQTGVPISQVIAAKEKKLDFENIDYDDDVQFALDAYYDQLIRYVFSHFAKKFAAEKTTFEAPLDVVVAGGTSMPNGFCGKVQKVINDLNLPFEVREVRHAKSPRTAVVEGLYVSANVAMNKAAKAKQAEPKKEEPAPKPKAEENNEG